MGREARDHRDALHPRPVMRIELNEKRKGLRLFLTVFLAFFGVACICYAVRGAVSTKAGWTEIDGKTSVSAFCAGEFILRYELGREGVSPAKQKRIVSAAYSKALQEACYLFDADIYAYENAQNYTNIGKYDGKNSAEKRIAEKKSDPASQANLQIHGLAYLNEHLNEPVVVGKPLYEALYLLQEKGDKGICLGPVYECYRSLFFSKEDREAEQMDPVRNQELYSEIQVYLSYVKNPAHFEIRLLSDNQVELFVSEEFGNYMRENWEEHFLDLGWMKNAFITDYVADKLREQNFTHGILTSYDGYERNLDESDVAYELGNIGTYHGPMTIVRMQFCPVSPYEAPLYYRYLNGEIRVRYIDPADGVAKASVPGFVCFGREYSCAEMMLEMKKFYLADKPDPGVLKERKEGIGYLYETDGKILSDTYGLVQ